MACAICCTCALPKIVWQLGILKWGSVLVGFKPFSIIHQKWWQLSLHSSMFQGVWAHWTAQKSCWSCLGPFWRCKHESIVIAHRFDCIAMILLMHNGDAKHRHQIQFPNANRSAHSTNLLGFHFWMVRFSNDMMETKKPKSYMTGGPWLLRGERVCSRMVKRLGARKQSSKH